MALEKARAYLAQKGFEDRIIIPEQSSATVAEAAAALGCAPGMIAKTLSFLQNDRPVLILAEGMARIDNQKYRARFGCKAKMIPPEQLPEVSIVESEMLTVVPSPYEKTAFACVPSVVMFIFERVRVALFVAKIAELSP